MQGTDIASMLASEEVKDYYFSAQSADYWHMMNQRFGKDTITVNKVNGVLYTERVLHGQKPFCRVTDAVLVASGVEGVDVMVEYPNIAW